MSSLVALGVPGPAGRTTAAFRRMAQGLTALAGEAPYDDVLVAVHPDLVAPRRLAPSPRWGAGVEPAGGAATRPHARWISTGTGRDGARAAGCPEGQVVLGGQPARVAGLRVGGRAARVRA